MNNNYTFQSKKKKSGIILHFCKFSLKSGRTEDRFLIPALLLHSGCCNNMLFGLFLKTVQPRADMWFGKWKPHRLPGRASGTAAVLRTHCDYHLLKLTRAHPWSWPGSDRTNRGSFTLGEAQVSRRHPRCPVHGDDNRPYSTGFLREK